MDLPRRTWWWGPNVELGSGLPPILIVEDEFFIQEMVEHALAEGGFVVECVSSGEKALALLQRDTSKYRALITDINLQGVITGWDVAKSARELIPDIPVVYMTGAAAEQWTSHGVPNSLLLNKPFAAAQVVTAVSQLLNASGPLPDQN